MEFDVAAFEDLAWWVERDRPLALRIIRLIREIQQEPFTGVGKPEPLKHGLSGCWSRRIDREHRIVYQVQKDKDTDIGMPLPLLTAIPRLHPLE